MYTFLSVISGMHSNTIFILVLFQLIIRNNFITIKQNIFIELDLILYLYDCLGWL